MSDQPKELKWFDPYDRKMHKCKVMVDNDDNLDLSELLDSIDEVRDNNEEQCKKIMWLGVALTGSSPGGRCFLDGWLARSLRDKFEEKYGKWNIVHESEQPDPAELKKHFVKLLRTTADKIESDEDFNSNNAPIVRNRGNGTELFE